MSFGVTGEVAFFNVTILFGFKSSDIATFGNYGFVVYESSGHLKGYFLVAPSAASGRRWAVSVCGNHRRWIGQVAFNQLEK